MKIKEWYSERRPTYIWQRAQKLFTRYQFSSTKAVNRIDRCMEGLLAQDCTPTFLTPGIVVNRFPKFFRHLQDDGAEIAVHGFQHVDLNAYPKENACKQLTKAVEAFKSNGLDVYGFRCPYLGCNDDLLDALPKGLFRYSSNNAIYWNFLDGIDGNITNVVIETLRNLYKASPSNNVISVPSVRPNMLEIPVCLPDDFELIDGLNLSGDNITKAWGNMLDRTHQRGEMFTLIFHPELAAICEQSFHDVLSQAKLKKPQVWVTKLCDISDWWIEKAGFRVEVTPTSTGIHIDFICSPRATILLKNIEVDSGSIAWDSSYQRFLPRSLELPASPRPFIGVSENVSKEVTTFLQNQGYILDMTDQAHGCSIILDKDTLAPLKNEVQLIDYIEGRTAPLIRYWRWPDGAKSALSITGDLDALSLMDYLSRIYIT